VGEISNEVGIIFLLLVKIGLTDQPKSGPLGSDRPGGSLVLLDFLNM
jgi:hypothetical protein